MRRRAAIGAFADERVGPVIDDPHPWTRSWLEGQVRAVTPGCRVTLDEATKPGTVVILVRVGARGLQHKNGAWWARKTLELRIRDRLNEHKATRPVAITYRIEVRR